MNIVKSSGKFQIYGSEIETHRQLPVGTYDLNFNKLQGFYLTERAPLSVTEKVYGNSTARTEKILKTFKSVGRNLGVILSGQKGIGKTMFAKVLAEAATKQDIPVINVGNYLPGISSFMEDLRQEVLVLFDEFEKTFREGDDSDPQEELLSMFDGTNTGKKLFVITCNDTNKLNTYLLNRPGRFHYHFTFDVPTQDEIEEYLRDNLKPTYRKAIDSVLKFSAISELTYDCLRAITQELNSGYSLAETVQDLNIDKSNAPSFMIKMYFTDGSVAESTCREEFDPNRREKVGFWLNYAGIGRLIQAQFVPSSLEIGPRGTLFGGTKVKYRVDFNELNSSPKNKALIHKLENLVVDKLVCEPAPRFPKFRDFS